MKSAKTCNVVDYASYRQEKSKETKWTRITTAQTDEKFVNDRLKKETFLYPSRDRWSAKDDVRPSTLCATNLFFGFKKKFFSTPKRQIHSSTVREVEKNKSYFRVCVVVRVRSWAISSRAIMKKINRQTHTHTRENKKKNKEKLTIRRRWAIFARRVPHLTSSNKKEYSRKKQKVHTHAGRRI